MFFFVISPTKLRRFWQNLVHSFLNKFAAESLNLFPPRLNNVSTLPCKTWNTHRYHRVVTERNSRIYSTLTVASKFARFETSRLQSVGNIAREGVQNTHHWHERTETVTENGRRQLSWIISSLRQPFVSGVVDRSRLVMRVCIHSLAIFPTFCNQLYSNLEGHS